MNQGKSEVAKQEMISVGEGNGTPLQYSCLENPMDGGTWKAAVHGAAKSRTWLSDFTFTFHFHAWEKEIATHSHDWATSLSRFTFMHWRRKWQPTPVFLSRESQGQWSLVGCCLWGRTELDTTEATSSSSSSNVHWWQDASTTHRGSLWVSVPTMLCGNSRRCSSRSENFSLVSSLSA